MSAIELLEEVKKLPAREKLKFFESVHEMEDGTPTRSALPSGKKVNWPDAEKRRRKIFGDKILPNLVLLARDEEPY